MNIIPYRNAFDLKVALAEPYSCVGSQFDEKLVEIFEIEDIQNN